MAIYSVSQLGAGRRGNGTLDSRQYTVVLQVIVTDRYDSICTVANAAGVPLRYQPYVGYENTDDPLALCTKVDPEQDGEDWQKWRVTCTFDTNWNQNEQPQNENPEDDPPIFWIETEFADEPVTKEWDGTDIKNSAGQLIAGLQKRNAKETWVWEKNHTSINRSFWKAYQNTVNNSSFDELEEKEGRLSILVPKPVWRNGVKYYRVQYRIEVNKDKWTVNPADRGTAVKNSSGKLERPSDEKGQPFDGEVPLKSDGKQERDSTAAIRYIGEKDLYEPKNFDALGLI